MTWTLVFIGWMSTAPVVVVPNLPTQPACERLASELIRAYPPSGARYVRCVETVRQ